VSVNEPKKITPIQSPFRKQVGNSKFGEHAKAQTRSRRSPSKKLIFASEQPVASPPKHLRHIQFINEPLKNLGHPASRT
jgi:hypothetical protein